eukprot:CAMPEP_0119138882 /NCGR_PEP_ID=MMETSP1310-20130426/26503_1 /TAXON_ID=464262 /ORGANISM="Genus nov. species nov., Strain RCC2339" /LENGTH=185 /DNA_ID=CAMNT_0007130119 /DNA_START=78 /DNA_END=635 /DNA_ORIENTATION=+
MTKSQPKKVEKLNRFYPADDVPHRLHRNKRLRPRKIRASITPGAVVILVAGRFGGKRAVVLKVLDSGLLLVSGPFQVNGVPLRRVDQRYVIATKTRIDVSNVKIPDHVNDSYFQKPKKERKAKTEGEFFEGEKKEKKELPAGRKEDQTVVDQGLVQAINGTPQLADYLKSHFSLQNGQYPHAMVF